jgi:hypothetical protein
MSAFWEGFLKQASVASTLQRGFTRRGVAIEGREAVRKKIRGARPAPQPQTFPGTSPLPTTPAPAPKPDFLNAREARKLEASAPIKKAPSGPYMPGFVQKHPALTAGAVGVAGGMYLGSNKNNNSYY